jgi:hypothetical protein
MKVNIELSQEELVAIYAALKYTNYIINTKNDNRCPDGYVINDDFIFEDLIQKIYLEVYDDCHLKEIDEILEE